MVRHDVRRESRENGLQIYGLVPPGRVAEARTEFAQAFDNVWLEGGDWTLGEVRRYYGAALTV